MVLKVKKLVENAVIPVRSKHGDAGLDLFAISMGHNARFTEYFTGLAIEIPYGYVGLIFPRSSLSRYDMLLANSVGVVDSGYRGEISIRFKTVKNPLSTDTEIYKVGDRVAQLVILELPDVLVAEVDELSSSERGNSGYGSTGK